MKKQCTKCKKYKYLDEFYTNKNHSWCITCYRDANLTNYHRNPQAYMERQLSRRRANPELNNSYRKRHPEKYKAHNALSNAIRDRKIIKPSACEKCGTSNKKIHGHHWHGYDKDHWLDVQWLCPICHKSEETIVSR